MRRYIFALLLGGALAAGVTLSGCPAAHNDYPGQSCKNDPDCYLGEHCMNATICVPNTDLAVQFDLAHTNPGSDGGADDLAGAPADLTTGADL